MFTGLLAISGTALAGKGNTTVTIQHVPPSSNGDGSTAIEDGSIIMDVSVPSVPAHIGHGDCIVDDSGQAFPESDYCNDGNGGGEEQ